MDPQKSLGTQVIVLSTAGMVDITMHTRKVRPADHLNTSKKKFSAAISSLLKKMSFL
jgi:hypothetical protein